MKNIIILAIWLCLIGIFIWANFAYYGQIQLLESYDGFIALALLFWPVVLFGSFSIRCLKCKSKITIDSLAGAILSKQYCRNCNTIIPKYKLLLKQGLLKPLWIVIYLIGQLFIFIGGFVILGYIPFELYTSINIIAHPILSSVVLLTAFLIEVLLLWGLYSLVKKRLNENKLKAAKYILSGILILIGIYFYVASAISISRHLIDMVRQ
ncbi:MAG: hypothetical protein WC980_05630 [Candidatus Brocadiia bacterium]